MSIQKAINEAMRDIASIGIAKSSKNQQQGYNYRGIEAAMNELSPIMVNRGIIVTHKYSELTVTERAKEAGKATRFVTLKGKFIFQSSDDNSFVDVETYGEAMDSGDKAVIKAQSVAFRSALFQLFVVPFMAMDTELEGGEPEDDALLTEFRDAALKGTKALEALFKSKKPAAQFWTAHSPSLKQAAAEADRESN